MSSGLPPQTQSLLETTFKWRQICLTVSLYTCKIVYCVCLSAYPLFPPYVSILPSSQSRLAWCQRVHTRIARGQFVEICQEIYIFIYIVVRERCVSLLLLGCPSSMLQSRWMLPPLSPLSLTLCSHLNNNSWKTVSYTDISMGNLHLLCSFAFTIVRNLKALHRTYTECCDIKSELMAALTVLRFITISWATVLK